MKKFVKCQCCGMIYNIAKYKTNMSTICSNCEWEQDWVDDIDDISYANKDLTIRQARQNMLDTGNIYGKKKLFLRKTKLFL